MQESEKNTNGLWKAYEALNKKYQDIKQIKRPIGRQVMLWAHMSHAQNDEKYISFWLHSLADCAAGVRDALRRTSRVPTTTSSDRSR